MACLLGKQIDIECSVRELCNLLVVLGKAPTNSDLANGIRDVLKNLTTHDFSL